MNSLSVLFKTEVHLPIFRRSCSNLELLRILLIIWIAVIMYWQYFIIKYYFRKQISLLINQGSCWNLLLCYFSWIFGFQIVVLGSQIQNQDEFTVSFILRQKFIFLFLEKDVRILSFCNFSWPFKLQLWCTGIILLMEVNFSSH